MHLHFGMFPVKAVLLVTDMTHRVAGGLFHGRLVVGDLRWAAHFTGQNDQICRGQGFAGDPGIVGVGGQEHVDDGIGDLIADFVGMPFGYGFRSKEIVAACHKAPPARLGNTSIPARTAPTAALLQAFGTRSSIGSTHGDQVWDRTCVTARGKEKNLTPRHQYRWFDRRSP
jgi:hypothetical protein